MSERSEGAAEGLPRWVDYSDEELLDLRLCDLGVTVEGSMLEERIQVLDRELSDRGIDFRAHFWLSDDWFTPDGVPGIGIPFYMAHERLMALERSQMLEVEGGTPEACLRFLRHEMGHAIDNAYLLRRRRYRQRIFGKTSQPYPELYEPKPYSRSYVRYLEAWYAQSHPDEDFAETFAVWLDPKSDWRKKYAHWPALKKLEYMDRLMKDIGKQKPLVGNRRKVSPLSVFRKTLREHYRVKRDAYEVDFPDNYDRDLQRLFPNAPEYKDNPSAAAFISGFRKELRRIVSRRTGIYQYTIDQVLEEMIQCCKRLDLKLCTPVDETRFEFAILLTVHTMDYLHSGRYRLAL